MKFMAGLRVWGDRGSLGNVLKVFPRLRASANRRVGLHLSLIASIAAVQSALGDRSRGAVSPRQESRG
jgi:hypothetical protein